jgi:PilZ domain
VHAGEGRGLLCRSRERSLNAGPQSAPGRVPYVARCEMRVNGALVEGLVCDVSPFGCFVNVEPPIEGEFDIKFPLPDGGPPAEARAAVTWVRSEPPVAAGLPVGVGVRFVLMSQLDRRRVSTLVEAFIRVPSSLLGAEQPYSQAVRVPLIAPCALVGEFGTAHGKTCNLSIFGVYAAVEPIPPAGAPVEIEIELPRRERPFVKRAMVTWRNEEAPTWERPLPAGCGVRFDDLSLKDVRYLSSLVEEFLTPPAVG